MKKKALLAPFVFLLTMQLSYGQLVHEVQINANGFSPSDIRIEEGDNVIWINNTSQIQNVTSGTGCNSNGMFNSGNIEPGNTFAETFADIDGTFSYFNGQNCPGPTGTVTVVPLVVQGLTAQKKHAGFELKTYPNPTADIVSIDYRLHQASEVTIEIRNLIGEKLMTLADNNTLPQGSYTEKIDLSAFNAEAVVCVITTNTGGNSAIIMKAK